MQPPEDLPEVLTVQEAAAFLRIGRDAVYAAVRKGELPAIRIGRYVRFNRDRLRAFAGSLEREGPPGALTRPGGQARAATTSGPTSGNDNQQESRGGR
ncbi:MAG TPA: helix-turn-helix domain-containing protein [Actinomycetota bacterium]|nr:helix-turn-helix domain-containing protein [Actinomycetota bacterium]